MTDVRLANIAERIARQHGTRSPTCIAFNDHTHHLIIIVIESDQVSIHHHGTMVLMRAAGRVVRYEDGAWPHHLLGLYEALPDHATDTHE